MLSGCGVLDGNGAIALAHDACASDWLRFVGDAAVAEAELLVDAVRTYSPRSEIGRYLSLTVLNSLKASLIKLRSSIGGKGDLL